MCNYKSMIALMGAMTILASCVGPQGIRFSGTPIPEPASTKAQIYSAHCGNTCHALPHPKRHAFSAWQGVIQVMDQRISERGMAPIPDADREAIFAYLRQYGR